MTICFFTYSFKSRDRLVGMALDDRGSRVRFLAGAGNFSLHHRLQNGSEAHPASYLLGTRGSFPGGKAAGAWNWALTSNWCRGQRMIGVIPPAPQYIFTAWYLSTGTTSPFTFPCEQTCSKYYFIIWWVSPMAPNLRSVTFAVYQLLAILLHTRKVWRFHADENKIRGFLGWCSVVVWWLVTNFRRTVLPPSSGLKCNNPENHEFLQ
jgi:hypothetical protein